MNKGIITGTIDEQTKTTMMEAAKTENFVKDIVKSNVEYVVDNIDEKTPLDYSAIYSGIYNKVAEDVESMGYIELKQTSKHLEDTIGQIRATKSLSDSLENMAQTMVSITGEYLESKMTMARVLGDESIKKFQSEGTNAITELARTKELVDKTLAERYPDVTVTTSFFTDEMVKLTTKRMKNVDELDMTDEAKAEAIQMFEQEIEAYKDRANVWKYSAQMLFGKYGKYIKKAKQYTRNMPDKTFNETKQYLANRFGTERMYALQEQCMKHWESEGSLVTFFTFLKMVLERRTTSTDFALANLCISIMIMNACDMAADLWDLGKTKEEYIEEIKEVEARFKNF